MIVEVVLESLKCEVIVVSVGFEPNPSSERWIVVWLSAYPSKCRGDLCCALPLSVEVVLVERGVVYSRLYLPKSSVEVPCVGSPVWTS